MERMRIGAPPLGALRPIAVNEIIRVRYARGFTRHYRVIGVGEGVEAGTLELLRVQIPGIDDAREMTRGSDGVLR